MIDLQAIFKNKRFDEDKLLKNGFSYSGHCYAKEYPIMEGQFCVKITISIGGTVDFCVYDTQTQEEYYLARVKDAAGAFVGEVHAACEEILSSIAEECFHTERFQNGQTMRVLQYIKERYGSEPEFLWEKFPEFAVLRVPGKKPWFALLGRVEKRKFSLAEGGIAEVINLKNEPQVIISRIAEKRAYPAYHMNKRCWFTTFLDDTLPDEEIFSLIDASFKSVTF